MSRGNDAMKAGQGGDRPLRRKLVKLACQILLGRKRAHYHSWLPGLSIRERTDVTAGVAIFGGARLALQKTDMLRRRAEGGVTIVGSGPSVREAPLERLPRRSALLLNGAISLIGAGIADPFAIAIEDERFVWRHFAMMAERIGRDIPCLFSPGVIRAIFDIDPYWLTGRNVILIDDIRKPYGAPRRSAEALSHLPFVRLNAAGDAGFSLDPDRGVFQGGSVAISALQFVLSTGAPEIGFIGVDISNAAAPRFYERPGETAYSGVADAEARILAHIELANRIAEERGQRLINHSPVSALARIGLAYEPIKDRVS
jgi:hypothetical protein